MTREEQVLAAFEHLNEAAKLLTFAGFSLLAEEIEELALQASLQTTE